MLVKSDSERKGEVRTYLVRGQVFFASAEQFFPDSTSRRW